MTQEKKQCYFFSIVYSINVYQKWQSYIAVFPADILIKSFHLKRQTNHRWPFDQIQMANIHPISTFNRDLRSRLKCKKNVNENFLDNDLMFFI